MKRPPEQVLAGFGLRRDVAERLAGGRGTTWRVGDVVLKPVDDAREHAWVCEVYAAWPADAGVAVPRPLAATTGGWAVGGWSAHWWVPGTQVRPGDDPVGFRRAADAFHAVTAPCVRPGFLDDRDDPWSHGDRVAWEAAPSRGGGPLRDLLDTALSALEPVDLPAQVVHGDLAGNVLSSTDGPGVIDWPPYFRPQGWALAVVAVDALCWQGAAPSLLDAWSDVDRWRDLLLRALAYRLATRLQHDHAAGDLPEASVLDLVLARGG